MSQDPEFKALPEQEKIRVFQKADPDFARMSAQDQNKVMLRIGKPPESGSATNVYVDKIQSAYPESFEFDLPEGFKEDPVVTGFDTRTGNPIYAGGTGVHAIRPKEIISSISRPILEAGGSVAGALIASPGVVTTAAGGGLGFTIGAEVADLIDQYLGLAKADSLPEELKEAGKRVVIGTAMEMGGQAAAVGVETALRAGAGLVRKLPALTAKGAQIRAGEVLAANTSSGPIIAKNIEEAAMLEQEIPGLKFSKGALTNDPEFIKFERAQERGPYGFAADSIEAKTRNTEAITDYVNKIKGKGTLEDVRATGEVTRGKLGESVTAAEAGLELETSAMGRGMGPQDVGETIRGVAKGEAKSAKQEAGKLFGDLPDMQVDGSSLIKKIDKLSRPLSKFEAVGKNVPESFEQIKATLEETGGAVTPGDLQGLRSMLTDDIRDLKSAAVPNNKLLKRQTELLRTVDEVFETAGEVAPKELPVVDDPIKPIVDVINRESGADDGWLVHAGEIPVLKSKPGYVKQFVDGDEYERVASYGEVYSFVKPDNIVEASDISEEVLTKLKADFNRGLLRPDLEDTLELSGADEFMELFDPDDIVDSAGAWDNSDFTEWFSDSFPSYGMVKTYNGGVMLSPGDFKGTSHALSKDAVEEMAEGAYRPKPPEFKAQTSETISKKLKSARTAWKKGYIEKFKQGTVNDILRKGPDGADKVQSGQIAGRFFKPGVAGMDAADDFIKAIGDDPKAKEAIRDYVRQDMIANAKNPTTGEITAIGLNRWKAKYKRALDKFGLSKEFDTIEKARKQLDQAVDAQAEFEKSAAAKLLDSDPLKAVQNALSKGSKASAAHNLMSKITDDRMAVSGLQNAMVDHILLKDVGELRTIAKMDALIKEYDPALRVIFEANPRKYESIKTVRNAVKTLGRTNASPLGGGSDTAENLLSVMAKEGGMATWKIAGIVQAAMAPFKQLSEVNVNRFINRAILDPEYARTLTMMAKGMDDTLIVSRLKAQLAKIGIMSLRGKEAKKKPTLISPKIMK